MTDDPFNQPPDADPHVMWIQPDDAPQVENFRDCGRCFLVSRNPRFVEYVEKAAGEMNLEGSDAAHIVLERFHTARHDNWEIGAPRVYVYTSSELCNLTADDGHDGPPHEMFSGHFELSVHKDLTLGLHMDLMSFSPHFIERFTFALIEGGHGDIADSIVSVLAQADRFGWSGNIENSPFASIAPALMAATYRRIYRDTGAQGVFTATANILRDVDDELGQIVAWINETNPSVSEIAAGLGKFSATFGKSVEGLEEAAEEAQAKALNKKIRDRKKARKEDVRDAE